MPDVGSAGQMLSQQVSMLASNMKLVSLASSHIGCPHNSRLHVSVAFVCVSCKISRLLYMIDIIVDADLLHAHKPVASVFMRAQMLAPGCCVTRLSKFYSVSIPASCLHLQTEFLPVLLLPLQSPCGQCWYLHRQKMKHSTTAPMLVCKCRSPQM